MKFEDLKKLHQKRYREEFGHFLVEGEHLVLELQKAALRNPQLQGCEIYVTGDRKDWRSSFTTHVVTAGQMAQLTETRTPQGIVALAPVLSPAAPRSDERLIYLHEIQDPGNLGTVLRTLGWFGRLRCLLSPGSVDPHNSKVVRASMGAIFHVPVEVDVELAALRARCARIACLDLQGAAVSSPDFKSFDCYLFGNEARGLPRDQLAALGGLLFDLALLTTLRFLIRQEDARSEK